MARGGKRAGSGRTPLALRNDCGWIVDRVRKLGDAPDFMRARAIQLIKRQAPDQLDTHLELHKEYDKVSSATISQRRAMIKDDFGTPLEEVRELLATEGFPKHLPIPSPNPSQMNQIYRIVAAEAAEKFGRSYSVRNVKDCVHAWLAFEESFNEGR